jgi:twitching motility protein PilT
MQIHELFEQMAAQSASDLHITAGVPPMIRVHGDVAPMPYDPLTPVDTKQLCYSVLTEQQKKKFEEESELDFSFGVQGLSRFRGNLFCRKAPWARCFAPFPRLHRRSRSSACRRPSTV